MILFCGIFMALALQIDSIEGDCGIVTRKEWDAVEPERVQYMPIPLDLVIIQHTDTRNCVPGHHVICTDMVRNIQTMHKKKYNASDIGYSFLIGGDSKVYEGTGWLRVSNESDQFSKNAIEIAFIGKYDDADEIPSTRMMRAVKELLNCGVEKGHLTNNYLVVAQSQLVPTTTSPGKNVYSEIMKWPEWERDARAIINKVLGQRYAR